MRCRAEMSKCEHTKLAVVVENKNETYARPLRHDKNEAINVQTCVPRACSNKTLASTIIPKALLKAPTMQG